MFMMYFTCRHKRGLGGNGSERREVKGRDGLVFPFFLPRSNVAVNLSPVAQLWFHLSFKIVVYLSLWRNNESFKWSHRRIFSALTQKRQPFATLKNFLTWTKFKIYFVKLFAVIIALKYFSLFSNLLSFFGLTRVGCFCYKSKSYLHSSFLPKFFPSLQLTWFLRLVF